MMSSATSIRRTFRFKADVPAKPATTGPKDGRPTDQPEPDAGFRAWHFFVLVSLAAATAAVLMSRRSAPEHLILISFTIGAAGVAAAAFYRMLIPLTVGDVKQLSDRPSDRALAAIEREKALVLRSIKELEFDRAMGKVSPKDFDEMAGRLRARAIMLMKQVDAGSAGYRELIERELQQRLRARQFAGAGNPPEPAPIGERAGAIEIAPPESTAPRACAACGTANDHDAAFCKRCGTPLAASMQ
jgi:hypothetical protein